MRLSCIQCDVRLGEAGANAEAAASAIRASDADVVVLPECALTGYAVASRAAAEGIAIPRDDPALLSLHALAVELGKVVVVGFAERDGDTLHNAAAILGLADGPAFYRKTHLPELGYDRFVAPGGALPVFDTPFGRLGVLICFDLRAPEPMRVLALAGAEVVVLPTNWPEGAEVSADLIALVRALESRVFLATCDRVGEEGGFRFIGRSKIVGPGGEVLASAGAGAAVLSADLDLAQARDKRIAPRPGAYEMAVFGSRRPELYEKIVAGLPEADKSA